MRSYMELLGESIERMSGGAIRLEPVPAELRISQSSLAALRENMWEARRRNVSAWNSSERNAGRRNLPL